MTASAKSWESRGYLSAAQLAHRPGWTSALIMRLLGNPCREEKNPYYGTAGSMRLYSLRRIEAMEKTAEFTQSFQSRQNARLVRIAAAARTVETKRKRLLDWVDGLQIILPVINRDVLIRRACASFNARVWDRAERHGHDDPFAPARPDSDPAFIERISVNYLRHSLTGYDEKLRRLAGKTGKEEAAAALRTKVLRVIGEYYPWLAEEAKRQEEQ